MGPFSKYFEKNKALFCKYFEKNTPSSGRSGARRAPPEAAPGVFFQNIWKTDPFFSKYLENRPIHIFQIDTFQLFQITTIYKGTQVTSTVMEIINNGLMINNHS